MYEKDKVAHLMDILVHFKLLQPDRLGWGGGLSNRNLFLIVSVAVKPKTWVLLDLVSTE